MRSLKNDVVLFPPKNTLFNDASNVKVPFAVTTVVPLIVMAISPDLYAKATLTIPEVKTALEILIVPDVVAAVIELRITFVVRVRKVIVFTAVASSILIICVSLALLRYP